MPSWHVWNFTSFIDSTYKLEACMASWWISSGCLETPQWTIDIILVCNGSVFIAFWVYKWTLYMRLTRGLCTVYVLSPGYPWDIVLSVLNFQFFMGPVFILQVHARKFCGQVTCLLMFIIRKSYFHLVHRLKDVWSYNFIFTVLISKYFPECSIDNATSCYMNRWQSPDNGCCLSPQ
jgi:hypothetical protein